LQQQLDELAKEYGVLALLQVCVPLLSAFNQHGFRSKASKAFPSLSQEWCASLAGSRIMALEA